MLRLLSDECFDGRIVRGLHHVAPTLDLVRVQDVGLSGIDDLAVLAWAAAEDRILLTHDRQTIPGFAYALLADGASRTNGETKSSSSRINPARTGGEGLPGRSHDGRTRHVAASGGVEEENASGFGVKKPLAA